MVSTEEQQEVVMQVTILLPMHTVSRLVGQDRTRRTTISSMEPHMATVELSSCRPPATGKMPVPTPPLEQPATPPKRQLLTEVKVHTEGAELQQVPNNPLDTTNLAAVAMETNEPHPYLESERNKHQLYPTHDLTTKCYFE
ncbi:hypothetical protein GBAR_LOCUS459 [Geodia barretti]|nr:hypothetical protein GBAR_LOCUS459 [Geodia barretti]